jgi:hypothetical protein
MLLRSWETFLYTLKAGLSGGLRPPSGRQRRGGHRGTGLTLHARLLPQQTALASFVAPAAITWRHRVT